MINFLVQDTCQLCNKFNGPICENCVNTNFIPKTAHCFGCGRLYADGRTCPSCRSKYALAGVITPFHLEGSLQDLIHKYKYEHDRALAGFFAKQLLPTISDKQFDILSFVPSDGARLRERGFNPAHLLAREIGKQINLSAQELLLRTYHVPQIGHSRAERFKQVQDNFLLKRHDIMSKNILLIDDVITTGATLNECARVLKQAGAKSVWGLVIAQR